MVTAKDVLFVGLESAPQTWYRCALPARALGLDWCGVDAKFKVVTGEVGGTPKSPAVDDYSTFVLQQPAGPEWLKRILTLKSSGARVLYEIDDYLHGISRVPTHLHAKFFNRNALRHYEACMEACDGLIVSTKFLAERYSKFGPTHLCPNGIDAERYAYTRPDRDFITVGWAGATGHLPAFAAWLEGGVGDVLLQRPDVQFVGMGLPEVTAVVAEELGEHRVRHVPWGPLESYPAALATCDIVLAPAGNTLWDRGKSDLRWLEASALGAACIADERRYPEAALQSASPEHAAGHLAALLDAPGSIRQIGDDDRQRVISTRSFPGAAGAWKTVLGLT